MKTPLQVTDPALIEQAIRRTKNNVMKMSLLPGHGLEDNIAESARLETMQRVLKETQRNG